MSNLPVLARLEAAKREIAECERLLAIKPAAVIEKWVAVCDNPQAGKFVKLFDSKEEGMDSVKPIVEWRKVSYKKGVGIKDITPMGEDLSE